MDLILVSAMTADRVIGHKNRLPWDIPEEYAHFLGLVRGHPVIFGRTSYEIFGADLQESPLIVVSSTLRSLPGAAVCPDVDSALEQARRLGGGRVFSAGGASIYRSTLPLAGWLYLSIVAGRYDGDRRFPEIDGREWVVERSEPHPRFEFRVYRRAAPRP